MTDTIAATSKRPDRLYQILAITGIAVGIFVILAGSYFLIARPGCGMDMSNMKMMDKSMDMPSMSPMPPMPSMSPMPTPTG